MPAEAVWAGWLLLFLVYELTAAARERGTTQRLTLSRNVWRWFDTPFRKTCLAVFLLTLTAHLTLGVPGAVAIAATAMPVAVIIGCRIGGLM